MNSQAGGSLRGPAAAGDAARDRAEGGGGAAADLHEIGVQGGLIASGSAGRKNAPDSSKEQVGQGP